MAWASQRKTGRTEDLAYCLLGIFHVNMPVLCGEGHKAFFRLQQETINVTYDDSILAWGRRTYAWNVNMVESMVETKKNRPMLKTPFAHPSEHFAYCYDTCTSLDFISPYTMTNRGLQIELPLIEIVRKNIGDSMTHVQDSVGFLTCKTSTTSSLLGIFAHSEHSKEIMYRVIAHNKMLGSATMLFVGPRLAAYAILRKVILSNLTGLMSPRGRSITLSCPMDCRSLWKNRREITISWVHEARTLTLEKMYF
jgi:hypothetical protein